MPNIIRIRNLVKEVDLSGTTFAVDKQIYGENVKRVDIADLKEYILSGLTFEVTGGTSGTSGVDGIDGIDGIDGSDGTSGSSGISPCITITSNTITIDIITTTTTTTAAITTTTTTAATTTTTTTAATTTTTTTAATTTTTTTAATTTTTTTAATTTTTTTAATTTTTTTEATTTTTTTTAATTTTTTTADPYNYYIIKTFGCPGCVVAGGTLNIKSLATYTSGKYYISGLDIIQIQGEGGFGEDGIISATGPYDTCLDACPENTTTTTTIAPVTEEP